MVTPQLGYHHTPGNHGNHQVPSNHKGRLLPLQPVHGNSAVSIVPSSLSTLLETSESSNNSLSLTNTPETLTEKVPKVSTSDNKFSDDSLDDGGVAANRLHPPHPHNVVFNRAFREGSQTLSPIWQLGRQLPNDEIEDSSSGNSDYITSYIGHQTPQPHLHPPQSPTRYSDCWYSNSYGELFALLVPVALETVAKVRVTRNMTHLVTRTMNSLSHMS